MNRTADIAQLEGRSIALGAHRFDAEGIIAFAREFDYQPFHLSEEEAAQTHFGALAASGWQTAAEFSRLLNAALAATPDLARLRVSAWQRANTLRWLRPVRRGDTVHFTCTLTRITPVDGGRAHAALLHGQGNNQHGERVYELEAEVQLSAGTPGSPRK